MNLEMEEHSKRNLKFNRKKKLLLLLIHFVSPPTEAFTEFDIFLEQRTCGCVAVCILATIMMTNSDLLSTSSPAES